MDQFIQYTPTEVVFGKETENQAGAEVKKWGGTKVPRATTNVREQPFLPVRNVCTALL